MKYWDADKFEQLLELPGHQGPVWGLAVSHLGDIIVSCGGDRSIRRSAKRVSVRVLAHLITFTF